MGSTPDECSDLSPVAKVGLHRIEWVELNSDAIGMEVESTTVEVNGIGKPLFVAESSAAHLDGLDPAVDAFSRTIAHLQKDRIQDAPEVILDGLGRGLDRFEPAPCGPGQPSFPALARLGGMHVMPQFTGHLLDGIRPGGLQ